MDLGAVPGHLVIAGGSYIGLEFAQMFRRFGAQVTILESADRLAPREDPDISAAIAEMLRVERIATHTGVREVSVAPTRSGIQVTVGFGARVLLDHGTHLLVATGRRPNVEALDLARAGVALDARGFVAVDDQLRTSADGVWALGDVHGRGGFTHTSYNDFEIVTANLLDGEDRRISERVPAYALFIDPPLARIGMSESQALQSGRPVLRGFMPMSQVGRARERGETFGFMKVLVDAQTRGILGAAFLGIEADEAIHVLLVAMAAGMTVDELRRVVAIHPTVSELVPTLLADLRPLDPAANPERMASIT
jgi:pyruvate/2-oxoglutarate dehydrogenase complex dihydrolipoamide dehydrogenase (E3) component